MAAAIIATVLLGGCPKAESPVEEPPADMTNETQRAAWRRMHDKKYLAKLEKQRTATSEAAAKIQRVEAALDKARAENAPEGRILALSNQVVEAYVKLDAIIKKSQQIVSAQIHKDLANRNNLNEKKGE